YSDSDIAVVKKLPFKDDLKVTKQCLTSCSPGNTGAKEIIWMEVESEELELTLKDFKKAIQIAKLKVNTDYIKQHQNY
ncbi:4674_t:CDS:2, partial [Funneliformis geosporum]